jgi:hypothetical protein
MVQEMIHRKRQDCDCAISLDWTDSEVKHVMCIHPYKGHIGNWAGRIIKPEERACDHFTRRSDELMLEK